MAERSRTDFGVAVCFVSRHADERQPSYCAAEVCSWVRDSHWNILEEPADFLQLKLGQLILRPLFMPCEPMQHWRGELIESFAVE